MLDYIEKDAAIAYRHLFDDINVAPDGTMLLGAINRDSWANSENLVAVDASGVLDVLDQMPADEVTKVPLALPSDEVWVERVGGIPDYYAAEYPVTRQGYMLQGEQCRPPRVYTFTASIWTAPTISTKPGFVYFTMLGRYNVVAGHAIRADVPEIFNSRRDPAWGYYHDGETGLLRTDDTAMVDHLASHETWLFKALALMNCRNIEATPTGSTTPRRIAAAVKRGPDIVHRTLKLTVPATVRKSTGSENDADPNARTRFHLCRGHFKNLTHPRYKTPGLHWWPAHWRGDPDAGEVRKDYQLVPAN
ncbi:hypothetical protein [Gemmata sp. SH-PL17]|uniref:hypothetical protein n=1 Tax=Gemmata sp. SH-PL17 TaxID=1630693 RepID=UPI0012FC102E|nr:hypothetical protein [Gemmata sp. SH-PL17]